MLAVQIAVAVLVLAAAGRMLWTWRRGSRRAPGLVPLEGGWGEPLRFRPGPAVLPEHDDDAVPAPVVQAIVRRNHAPTAPVPAVALYVSNPFLRAFSAGGAGSKGAPSP